MEWQLNTQEMLDLGKIPVNLRLRCHSGSCWLTQAGDPRDYILRPGEVFVSQQHSHLVMTALKPSRVEILQPPTAKPIRPFSSLWQKLVRCSPLATTR